MYYCQPATPVLMITPATIKSTGITPLFISADDGYSSPEAVTDVKELGVKDICLSGAKGKRLLGEDIWMQEEYIDGRRRRSAVESLMFTMKYVYEFGRMRRRGLKEVQAEMLEKVIAYNICRAMEMKADIENKERQVSVAKAK